MDNLGSKLISGRRVFLKAVLPAGAFLCLGRCCLLGAAQVESKAETPGQKHKFLEDSGMSFSDVFNMAYAAPLPIWRGLEREIGSEKLVSLLKGVIDELGTRESAEQAKKLGKNDLAAFTQDFRRPNPFWQHVLTYQVVADTPKAFEIKVTECLWAKTLREAKAGDLGYILSCYGDFAFVQGFNPKMKLIRTKTLMQGDEFCNHRYILEA